MMVLGVALAPPHKVWTEFAASIISRFRTQILSRNLGQHSQAICTTPE